LCKTIYSYTLTSINFSALNKIKFPFRLIDISNIANLKQTWKLCMFKHFWFYIRPISWAVTFLRALVMLLFDIRPCYSVQINVTFVVLYS
jgi:hypothetical protein